MQNACLLVYSRVNLVDVDPGWVDLYFGCSIACQILLRQMGIWQNWLDRWAKWWSMQIQVNPTKVCDYQIHPVFP